MEEVFAPPKGAKRGQLKEGANRAINTFGDGSFFCVAFYFDLITALARCAPGMTC